MGARFVTAPIALALALALMLSKYHYSPRGSIGLLNMYLLAHVHVALGMAQIEISVSTVCLLLQMPKILSAHEDFIRTMTLTDIGLVVSGSGSNDGYAAVWKALVI